MSCHSQDNLHEENSNSFREPENYKRTTKRIEDNFKICNDLQQLIQERADIEKSYAKSLRNWSKKWTELIEKGPAYGTTEAAWKSILTESEHISNIHIDIKEALCNNAITKIKAWQKDTYHHSLMQNKERKDMEDLFKKAQKPYVKLLSKVEKAKSEYYAARKAERIVLNQEENAVTDTSLSRDQIKKIHERVEKTKHQVQECIEKYQFAHAAALKYKTMYIEDMTSVYKKCEKMEKEHLEFFKNILFNIHSCLDLRRFSNISQIYEEFYYSINRADCETDLIWWSNNYGINARMNIPFIEYSEEITGGNKSKEAEPIILVNQCHITENKQEYSNGEISNNTVDIKQDNIPNGPNIDTYSTTTPAIIAYEEEGQWDKIDDTITDNNEPAIPVKALYDYKGVQSNELSFKKGDVFEKLDDRDRGWCKGRINGRVGLYPVSFVKIINPCDN